MEGITILNQTLREGAILEPWGGIVLAIIIGGVFGFLFFAFISNIWYSSSKFVWPDFLALLFAFCIIIGLGISAKAPHEEIIQYQVLIDEEVNFVEFNNRYKVVDQDGLIYTIEERESE